MPLTNLNCRRLVYFTFIILFGWSPLIKAKSFLVYSITQDLPMGDHKALKKNFYINIGAQQGIKIGSELTVYRQLNQSNPYSVEKSVTYNVRVGELKVIHSEEENAIAVIQKASFEDQDQIYHEIPAINVGDTVQVKTAD